MKKLIFGFLCLISLVGCDTADNFSVPPVSDGGVPFQYSRTDFLLGNRNTLGRSAPGSQRAYQVLSFRGVDEQHVQFAFNNADSPVFTNSPMLPEDGPNNCTVNLTLTSEDDTSRVFTFDGAAPVCATAANNNDGTVTTITSVVVTQNTKYPTQFTFNMAYTTVTGGTSYDLTYQATGLN